ncbi:MAG: sigma-70 family RNA polymerase sigma factor [Actinomycetota bacterium]
MTGADRPMTDRAERPGPAVTFHALDPAEGRALTAALDRLPVQASTTAPGPRSPSIRAVLDRFLSAPLREPLRALAAADGPAAVVIDGLPTANGDGGAVRQDPTEAVLAWLIEAAGLFAIDRSRSRDSRPSETSTADHVALFAGVGPAKVSVPAVPLASVAAAGAQAVDVELRPGTAVVADRRRIRLGSDERPVPERSWLRSVDLVADPWAGRAPIGDGCDRIEPRHGATGRRRRGTTGTARATGWRGDTEAGSSNRADRLADADLVARFRAGDEDAIRSIYRETNGAVYTVARTITADRELAADVVQQTYVKAWQAADRFRPGASITPWLYTITRRTAVDAVRHERRPTIGGHDAEVESAVPGPSFERTWIVHEVRAAIDALPPSERQIIQLSHLAGVPHREIARRLDLPLGTVKSKSSRAHRRLAERLQHLRDVPDESEPNAAVGP